ncbi:MAG: hypothetical protein EBV03_01095 [Proteobacteria bacterium]|nr:hypothetical protein [Pseudomonadota bacterium]
MYQIYLESGKMPKTRTVNTVNAGKTIKLEGEVQGLMNYEECWKRKPPCDEPADYQVVPIESLSSVGEITHSYGGDNNKLLLECVMKIGASGTYKAKNKP